MKEAADRRPGTASLATVAREWTRIGVTGFGGPPAHIELLRQLCRRAPPLARAHEFEDANAACRHAPRPGFDTAGDLLCLPGRRTVRGDRRRAGVHRPGGRSDPRPVGRVPADSRRRCGCGGRVPAPVRPSRRSRFTRPGADRPELCARSARATARAAMGRLSPCRLRSGSVARRLSGARAAGLRRARAGAAAAACSRPRGLCRWAACPGSSARGGLGALAWTAFKVGALSFGGGFVIIPLMQGDAVHVLPLDDQRPVPDAVALGQITPGPVVATVAAVGYAAHGVGRRDPRRAVAFIPSFSFVLVGGRAVRSAARKAGPRAFLDGAGPAAIGAIFGAAITLATRADRGLAVRDARRRRGRAAGSAPRRRRDASRSRIARRSPGVSWGATPGLRP